MYTHAVSWAVNPAVCLFSFVTTVYLFCMKDDLQFCITRKVPILLSQGRIKLIIIDSVAALFRSEFGLKDMVKRAKQLSSFAGHLQKLSGQYGAPVVCVNQVRITPDEWICVKLKTFELHVVQPFFIFNSLGNRCGRWNFVTKGCTSPWDFLG